jgi:hypothetical protein
VLATARYLLGRDEEYLATLERALPRLGLADSALHAPAAGFGDTEFYPGDRDIGATQRVRRGVRKLRKTTSNQMGGRQRGRLADDLVHLLALEATAAAVAEQIRVAVGRRAPRLPACCSRRRRSCSCR